MKVLTAAQMREVDRKTIELGISGLILMESAAAQVVEFLAGKFKALGRERIVVICGKGNNGGDGLAIARQLHTRFRPRNLWVLLAANPEDLQGDAAENYRMLMATGLSTAPEIAPEMRQATIVVDALLGTGFQGPARGKYAELIHEINTGFPQAAIVAVDVPSGLESDSGASAGESVRADHTVTFTAPKLCQVLSPASEACGELRVVQIGSPAALFEDDDSIFVSLTASRTFARLFRPRIADSNKGLYGHVLVLAGARGKTGAASMAGTAALRVGAGLVTVASAESAISAIASYTPELMTEPLAETEVGSIAIRAWDDDTFAHVLKRKDVVAIGPGVGGHPESAELMRRIVEDCEIPVLVDADALNALGQSDYRARHRRVFTPHPGEMSRLTGLSIEQVQADRIGVARCYAQRHSVTLVLKGNRTVIAFPDGRVFINPTGSPALAKGGTGDILAGLIAGLMAQFRDEQDAAVLAAVYLHGRAGELGAAELGEKTLIATDLFRFLPEAMREIEKLDQPV